MNSEEQGAGWKQQGGGEIKGKLREINYFLHSRNKFYHTQLLLAPCCSVFCPPPSLGRHMAGPEMFPSPLTRIPPAQRVTLNIHPHQ